MSLHVNKAEFERIINDPSAVYQQPEDVLRDERLSRAERIAILKQWAFDAREIEVAQEENMRGDASVLRQVLLALHQVEQSK